GVSSPSSFSFFADFSCTPTNQWPPALVQRQLLAEAIGTFFVVFAGCGSVVVNKMYGSVTFPGICITWGLIVMVMVYSVGHISGAHFNPAVTTTFAILKQFPFKQLPLYIVAQLVGAILASGALYLLFDPKAEHFYGTTPVGSAVQSFVLEIIISFLLMFVISGVATDTRAVSIYFPLPISGASMNPARSIGPAIVMRNYKAIWAYVLGPMIGALAGGFTYNLVRYTDKPLREITKSSSFLMSLSRNR
ncbi:hypothetical protein B296_00058946, partial [Ensete ventricosum]